MLEERIDVLREVAVNLLNLGIHPEIISEATELSIEEIKELPNFVEEYFIYRGSDNE